jgi:fructoselysine-6-P-deglycase FrlB-like protein
MAADPRGVDVMRSEIDTIPSVIADQVERLRPSLRELAGETVARGIRDIVLTGCGDSYFAGRATRLAFQRSAGFGCLAVEALELARYEIRYLDGAPPPLLVAASYSGEVGRTIEAAALADHFGWPTAALTGNPDSRLGRSVGSPIALDVPTYGLSPGTSTYVAMVAALLILAAELARAGGRRNDATALDERLMRAPELAASTLMDGDGPARDAADLAAVSPLVTFVGAGPSRATAAFGAAKLLEGAQHLAIDQDLEEWAHEQYFVSGPETPIVVIAPIGASRDRAAELIAEMTFIGAPVIFVSDALDDHVARLAAVRMPVGAIRDEAVTPLLTCLPLAQIGWMLSTASGARAYGFPSPAREQEHYETIHRDSRGVPA